MKRKKKHFTTPLFVIGENSLKMHLTWGPPVIKFLVDVTFFLFSCTFFVINKHHTYKHENLKPELFSTNYDEGAKLFDNGN